MEKYKLLILGLLLFVTNCGGGSDYIPPPIEDFPPVVNEVDSEALLALVNEARVNGYDCGTEGYFEPTHLLVLNDKLSASALSKTYDMAYSGKPFEHGSSGTKYDELQHSSNFSILIKRYYGCYHSVGENIGAGQKSELEVFKGWMKSDGHCRNIMASKFTDIGLAKVTHSDSRYVIYWTQHFGSKR